MQHSNKITPSQALAIQAEQIERFGERYPGGPEALRAIVSDQTDLVGLQLDAPLAMTEINERIPRGAAIEQIVLRTAPRRRRAFILA